MIRPVPSDAKHGTAYLTVVGFYKSVELCIFSRPYVMGLRIEGAKASRIFRNIMEAKGVRHEFETPEDNGGKSANTLTGVSETNDEMIMSISW